MILGIETSCDETSAAVVYHGQILSNVVSSQIDLHSVYGGVVPEVASRQHLKMIDYVICEALHRAKIPSQNLEAICVTRGPGLPSALLVGVSAARGLALRLEKPLLPIHHMEAHLYSPDLEPQPFIALVVSGGHTLLVHAPRFGEHSVLGQTMDDAAGEAFDKVAQLIGLGYPGGPQIEKAAKSGRSNAFDFPRPMLESSDWNFSFSGLKTAVRRTVASLRKDSQTPLDLKQIADLSASFQSAVVEVLVEKTIRAAKKFCVQQIAISGGVACNQFLRMELERCCRKEGMILKFADCTLCTDNAAMIALLAEKKLRSGVTPPKEWDIEPDWKLTAD